MYLVEVKNIMECMFTAYSYIPWSIFLLEVHKNVKINLYKVSLYAHKKDRRKMSSIYVCPHQYFKMNPSARPSTC